MRGRRGREEFSRGRVSAVRPAYAYCCPEVLSNVLHKAQVTQWGLEKRTLHLFQGRGITQALDQFLKLECFLFTSAESVQWLVFPASPISPHALFDTAHSKEEGYKGLTHICFLSDSRAPGRMFGILSISGCQGQGRELCHSLPLQNHHLCLSLNVIFEVYCIGC